MIGNLTLENGKDIPALQFVDGDIRISIAASDQRAVLAFTEGKPGNMDLLEKHEPDTTILNVNPKMVFTFENMESLDSLIKCINELKFVYSEAIRKPF